MTTGQLIYYSGIGLAVVTVIVAILFMIFRPKYKPGAATYSDDRAGVTLRLRNGYPTDKLTRRRGKNNDSNEPTEIIADTDGSDKGKATQSIFDDKINSTEKF